MISVFVTIAGSATAMFFTLTLAYPLSKKYLLGRNILLALISFTLVFGGGMIPTLPVFKSLGVINKF